MTVVTLVPTQHTHMYVSRLWAGLGLRLSRPTAAVSLLWSFYISGFVLQSRVALFLPPGSVPLTAVKNGNEVAEETGKSCF